MIQKSRKAPRTGASVGIHHANIRDQKRALKRLRAAFLKINVKLSVENVSQPVEATIVLSDISTKSAYLFSPVKVKKKTNLIFETGFPLAITVRAIVKYCEKSLQQSQLSGASSEFFRIYIEFKVSGDAERLALEDLYQKIRDENYVATNWHIYVTEKMQNEQRIRLQTEKLASAVADAQAQAQADAEAEAKNEVLEALPSPPNKKVA